MNHCHCWLQSITVQKTTTCHVWILCFSLSHLYVGRLDPVQAIGEDRAQLTLCCPTKCSTSKSIVLSTLCIYTVLLYTPVSMMKFFSSADVQQRCQPQMTMPRGEQANRDTVYINWLCIYVYSSVNYSLRWLYKTCREVIITGSLDLWSFSLDQLFPNIT